MKKNILRSAIVAILLGAVIGNPAMAASTAHEQNGHEKGVTYRLHVVGEENPEIFRAHSAVDPSSSH